MVAKVFTNLPCFSNTEEEATVNGVFYFNMRHSQCKFFEGGTLTILFN
jgi:hypothetical protein